MNFIYNLGSGKRKKGANLSLNFIKDHSMEAFKRSGGTPPPILDIKISSNNQLSDRKRAVRSWILPG
jgi:hypothetical protein